MTTPEMVLFGIGLSGLIALCLIIALMGRALSECPDTGRAARAGAIVMMTGFSAFGFGAVSMIAAMLPILSVEFGVSPLYTALAFVAFALGTGFVYAAERLRQIVLEAEERVAARKPSASSLPQST
ncbi:MAG: hypothetical protein AAGI50_10320 [Pseudomonadota bacterium]